MIVALENYFKNKNNSKNNNLSKYVSCTIKMDTFAFVTQQFTKFKWYTVMKTDLLYL